jgi:SAM-dependent methyltransferase
MARNDIELSWCADKRALDCGCGGGRYTVALKNLGFAEVVGVDWSENALETARSRAVEASIEGVTYQKADVLALPFEDESFDFVFSNGVLHHTVDTSKGVGELARVMKRNGRGWLYLYARPGGLDRVTHYLARLLLRNSNHDLCRRYCRALGLAGNRTFFLLDLWLTPVAECYTPAEAEAFLKEAGCRRWRRLSRGSDQDMIEQIWCGVPYAGLKYGVGENRYYFEGKTP